MTVAKVVTNSFVRWVPIAIAICAAHPLVGCGGDDGDTSLRVAWDFPSGDCESNRVETVLVTWGPQGGSVQDVEFPCVDGEGSLGSFGGGGTFTFDAVGLDANGVARAESFGVTSTFSGGGTGGRPIDITLHPQSVDVVVSWSVAGAGGCPSGVILPYFITLYRPPVVTGAEPSDEVTSIQETCSAGQATLTNVAPGDYIVEVDSRAVTPALRGTAPVTVEAGVDAMVSIDL